MCPLGERRGILVYCKVQGKLVSPIRYPCESKWQHCQFIKKRLCPLAKVEEGMIFCKLINKFVETEFCLSGNYKDCPIYKRPGRFI